MQTDYKAIGERIKQERKRLAITQETLAELCGISVAHMSNIECANTSVSLSVMIKIANALNCSMDTLLFGSLNCNSHEASRLISEMLDDCSGEERTIILKAMQGLKEALTAVRE